MNLQQAGVRAAIASAGLLLAAAIVAAALRFQTHGIGRDAPVESGRRELEAGTDCFWMVELDRPCEIKLAFELLEGPPVEVFTFSLPEHERYERWIKPSLPVSILSAFAAAGLDWAEADPRLVRAAFEPFAPPLPRNDPRLSATPLEGSWESEWIAAPEGGCCVVAKNHNAFGRVPMAVEAAAVSYRFFVREAEAPRGRTGPKDIAPGG